jgi:hypothetical protein
MWLFIDAGRYLFEWPNPFHPLDKDMETKLCSKYIQARQLAAVRRYGATDCCHERTAGRRWKKERGTKNKKKEKGKIFYNKKKK